MSYSIRITGFETEQQAIDFCNWYEGEGEQDVYLGETDLSANTDWDKCFELYGQNGFKADDFGEIQLPIKILDQED